MKWAPFGPAIAMLAFALPARVQTPHRKLPFCYLDSPNSWPASLQTTLSPTVFPPTFVNGPRVAHTFSKTPKKPFICHVNFSGDVLVAAGNASLRIAGCCCRRDKTELSHHADVIAGRVVIGDFAVSELQPVNMIGLEVFSGRSNAN